MLIEINVTEEDIQAGRLPVEVYVSPTWAAEQIDVDFVLAGDDVG